MRMAVLLRKDGIAFMLLAFCAMRPTCSAQAVSDTDCDPANNDATSGESAVCKAKDVNAECPANTLKCACKDRYKVGNPDSSTCVLKAVSDTDCDPANNDATSGVSAVCKAVDVNAECPAGTKKCACKDGYKEGDPESNTCVLKVVTETTCDSTNNDMTTGGAAVCKDVDENAVCPDGASECACKEKYKQGNPERNKCVLKEISDFSCNPSNDDAATGGAAVCKAVNVNAECPHGETRCKCKSGYKQDETVANTCVKVLKGSCTGDGDCSGVVENSECSTSTCSCVVGYKEATNLCKKAAVSEIACGEGNADCLDEHAECDNVPNTPKCKCSDGYKKDSNDGSTCVKIPISETPCVGGNDDCSDEHSVCDNVPNTPKCKCSNGYKADSNDGSTCVKIPISETSCVGGNDDCSDEHSECDNVSNTPKCKCSDGYEEDSSDGSTCVKTAGSSATILRMTTSLIVTSLLIYLPRFIFN